jgi:hypothetical protein
MSDDRRSLHVEIPPETNEVLREQEGFIWENVAIAIHETFGGERLTTPVAIEREIELQERKRRNAFERLQDAKEEYHRHEQRLESLRDRREEMAEQAETEADALDRVLQTMAEHGSNVYIGHGSVELLANQWFSGNEQAALGALKERSDKADYNFTENRFERPGANGFGSPATLRSVNTDGDGDGDGATEADADD